MLPDMAEHEDWRGELEMSVAPLVFKLMAACLVLLLLLFVGGALLCFAPSAISG